MVRARATLLERDGGNRARAHLLTDQTVEAAATYYADLGPPRKTEPPSPI
jgi:hypothetical protein